MDDPIPFDSFAAGRRPESGNAAFAAVQAAATATAAAAPAARAPAPATATGGAGQRGDQEFLSTAVIENYY